MIALLYLKNQKLLITQLNITFLECSIVKCSLYARLEHRIFIKIAQNKNGNRNVVQETLKKSVRTFRFRASHDSPRGF